MRKPHPPDRRRFDLPPEAETYLVWYGFLKRLPTTIFWLSLGYVAGFMLLNLGLWLSGGELAGGWLGLYYLGKKVLVIALFLLVAGGLSRAIRK
jgi:hypothetical protein